MVTYASKYSLLLSREGVYSIAMGWFLQTKLLVDKNPANPLLDIT
jgi:hypothetical protein